MTLDHCLLILVPEKLNCNIPLPFVPNCTPYTQLYLRLLWEGEESERGTYEVTFFFLLSSAYVRQISLHRSKPRRTNH